MIFFVFLGLAFERKIRKILLYIDILHHRVFKINYCIETLFKMKLQIT